MRKKTIKKNPDYKKNHTFLRGIQNMENDFDIMKVITTVRRTRALINVLLNRN